MPDPLNWETLPTPNPNEIMFRVRGNSNQIAPSQIPTLEQRYRSCPLPGVLPRMDEFSLYQYVHMEREGPYLWFYYGKPKTDEEKNTPFRAYFSTRVYNWDAVLEDLYAVKSTTFPQSVNINTTVETTARIFARYRYRPEIEYNSKILIEQFLSPTPWKGSQLEHDQPVPTNIQGSYIGIDMTFVKCLHPLCEFNELIPSPQIVQGVGTQNVVGGRNIGKQTFPATNFTDHAPFYLSDEQMPVQGTGMWLRERVKIYPPPTPEYIVR